ncbi:MAG: RHS repeat protein [Xanthomonadales bacterium]|nr:RHS repeat protein [Xanthomonadales bacterium]
MAWSYDANSNVASITGHTSAGRQTRSMTYDNRDRLLTVDSPLYPAKKGVGFIFIRPLSHPGPIDKVHAMLREDVSDPNML